MTDADPAFLELAALIRGALALSDRLRLSDVSICLDGALVRLAAQDASGTIQPAHFALGEDDCSEAGGDSRTRAA